jgi:hypothetical protein
MNNEEFAKVKVAKPVRRSQKILNITGETLPEDTGQFKLLIERIHDGTVAKAKPLIKKM